MGDLSSVGLGHNDGEGVGLTYVAGGLDSGCSSGSRLQQFESCRRVCCKCRPNASIHNRSSFNQRDVFGCPPTQLVSVGPPMLIQEFHCAQQRHCVCNHGRSFLSNHVSPELIACDSTEAPVPRWLPTPNEAQGEGRLHYGGL